MIKNILLACLTFFKIFVFAQDFSATYGFPEVTTNSGQTDPSNSPSISGLNFGAFNAFGTSINPSASARFSFTGWPIGSNTGDDNYGNYLAVLSPTIYYEVNLSVNPGYTLNLTALEFDVRRSGTGIRTFCVRSSLDNFTSNLSASTGTNSKLEVIPNDIFFWKYDSISSANDQKGSRLVFNSFFSALTGTVAFRFYAWNSEASGGSFSIDNVNFSGKLINVFAGLFELDSSNISPSNNLLEVFPNPSETKRIQVKSDRYFSTIEVISIEGKLLFSNDYFTPQKCVDLNLVHLPKGMYIVRCIGKEHTCQAKLILD